MNQNTNYLTEEQLFRAAPLIRVCAHPIRLRIIDFLRHQEYCVGDITNAAGCIQAVASQHLATLRQHGILSARRQGQRVYYSLLRTEMLGLIDCIRSHCDTSGEG
ncbi:MAG TPA: transcriptional regulator [Myxococcales bacterium]|nr:transcriptional regulator [Myxococcales bacterium]